MRKCGIYFCLSDDKVIYIGKTTDLNNRLFNHKYTTGIALEYDTVRFIRCDKSHLDFYERRWINKFKPRENKTYKSIKKTKNKNKMTFRILTEKSKMKFGKHRDLTVKSVMTLPDGVNYLRWCYYLNSHISFQDEILNMIGIGLSYRIDKPGTDPSVFEFLKANLYNERLSTPMTQKQIYCTATHKKKIKKRKIAIQSNLERVFKVSKGSLQKKNQHGYS